ASESEEHETLSPVAVQTQHPELEENDEMLTLQEMERRHVLNILQRVAGNRSQAAALLGITREGLRKKLLRIEKGDDVH
ncbi:MAG: helix-turn-helix domain-containing protein, partial [Deltaproteobacteria bacterium]|nr:helix-turn-helix domain-containing protein [Deltaproteobacteria bacterium]